MKKRCLLLGLVLMALLLGGCGAAPNEAASTPEPTQAPSTPIPTAAVRGALADQVRALLSPYEPALLQAALENPDSIACSIPGDVLMQMARDAADLRVSASGGRYVFSWHSQVESAYVATMDDAQEEMDTLLADVTPDPDNDAPIDSQQFGDYAVTGGGLFDRTRSYDMAENLQSGAAEFTEMLNGERTGYERFSFALRGNELYFVDASLDVAANLDELVIQDGYLVAVGVLRHGGLDVLEYHAAGQDLIPDPAALNLNQLLASVTPDRRVAFTLR